MLNVIIPRVCEMPWVKMQKNMKESNNCCASSFLRCCLSVSCLVGMLWHHLADDSGIPISNYKQDFSSISAAW